MKSAQPAPNMRVPDPAILVIGGICVAIEIALQLGDAGQFGIPRFRSLVLEYAAFWPGLLHDWRPNYPFQTGAMFLTYGFLHAGFWHLGLNMLTLWSLGRIVIDRVGGTKFAVIYAISIFGGGAGYGLMAGSVQPMVGASGALFGLAGAILAWDYLDRFLVREQLWPVARAALLLIALNVALYYAMGGVLAWEAHLGGFVAGWIAALLVDPRARTE